jgi:hypothetical protein
MDLQDFHLWHPTCQCAHQGDFCSTCLIAWVTNVLLSCHCELRISCGILCMIQCFWYAAVLVRHVLGAARPSCMTRSRGPCLRRTISSAAREITAFFSLQKGPSQDSKRLWFVVLVTWSCAWLADVCSKPYFVARIIVHCSVFLACNAGYTYEF